MKLKEVIQSSTKKIVLESPVDDLKTSQQAVPQTIGFKPQPDYEGGFIGDLSKIFTPDKKSIDAIEGEFLELAKEVENKFVGYFSDDFSAIYDGLKDIWGFIRSVEGRPAYSLGHTSQEGAIQVLFTSVKEIRDDIQSLKRALLHSPFLKITPETPEGMVLKNARKVLHLYLRKLRSKVEEMKDILTSNFEEQNKVGFEE